MKFEKEPLGFELKGFAISRMFDTHFIGMLGKQGVESSIDHVTIEFMYEDSDKRPSYVTIGYMSKKAREENRVSVTSTDPKSLEHMMKALEKVE